MNTATIFYRPSSRKWLVICDGRVESFYLLSTIMLLCKQRGIGMRMRYY